MAGQTFAGNFRHLGTDYMLVGLKHPKARFYVNGDTPWAVVEIATNRVWRFKTAKGAFQKRKALIAGVSAKVARGLPA